MQNKKILVVDDEPEVVTLLQVRLEKNGYKVITAYDGENGLKKAKAEIPDLIILDIMMPGMDGYEVAGELKYDSATKDIPIIMLTAKDMDVGLEKALKKKANWYIVKPYDDEHLLNQIKYMLKEQDNNKKKKGYISEENLC